MRGNGPVVLAQVRFGVGVDAIIDHLTHAWQHALSLPHSH
jgi:hypothetical protein